jgi:serine O-acetyltransferase
VKLLKQDLLAKQRLYCRFGNSYSMLQTILSDGTFASVLFRLQEMLASIGLPVLALVPHLINKWLHGCVIGTRATFGGGLVLAHPIGVVINSSVKGGVNLVIESGVVIGDNHGYSPVIGDNVFIGSGAKLIGRVSVGSGARVGANAVVLHDVAPGATVVGIPAKEVRASAVDPSDIRA